MPRRSTNNPRTRGKRQEFRRGKPKPCYFCKENIDNVDWKDATLLRKYMSDRAKIRSRRVNGNCPRHQRQVARAIKNAREMALLPYIAGR